MSNVNEVNKPATQAVPGQAAPKALGRGLGSLIRGSAPMGSLAPAAAPAQKATGIPSYAKLEEIELQKIEANPDQPRKIFDEERLKELSESLKQQGLVQPIVVRAKGDKFEIIAGERRWRAAKLAGLQKIPAIVRDDKISALENDLASLVENLQRAELSPLELATAYERTMSTHAMTQEQLAGKVGVSRVAVANTLRLLKLPATIKDLLIAGKISEGHARSLLSLENEKQMGDVAQKIVMRTLTVREAEQEVKNIKSGTPANASSANVPLGPEKNEYANLEEEFRRVFGTKVVVRGAAGRGTIEIYFSGSDSLHRIVHQMRALGQS